VAIRTGGVTGLFVVGFGLLGATVIVMLAQHTATAILVGFGFGGSLLALFMRVGGGIYTKAADVGGDLVGKVEAGIPPSPTTWGTTWGTAPVWPPTCSSPTASSWWPA
jgi:K(+)-stimulated pyrophosphate-energized sodium pump